MSWRDDDALAELLWLWKEAPDLAPSAARGIRSQLVSALSGLAETHEATRQSVERLRDVAALRLADHWQRLAWLDLNKILGDAKRVIAWLESLSPETAADWHLGHISQVRDVAWEQGRSDLLGRFLDEPVFISLREDHARCKRLMARLPREAQAGFARTCADNLRVLAATLHRSLLAAGREAEADEVAYEARRLDGSPEMAALFTAR